MTTQFLRKVRATFNTGLVINPGDINRHELTIKFSVSKGVSGTANDATIDILNLSEAHRNAIGKELDEITLEAGYTPPGGAGNVGVIFKGSFRDFEHKRDGATIITTISCGDGDKAFRGATIAKTYKEGAEVKDVVEDIYKELEKRGVKHGEFKYPDDLKPFKRPYTVCGSCVRELNTLGRGKKFYWSVQNGAMELIPHDGYLGGVVLITPQTGMVDVPSITDNGVKVTTLLNPEIRPNRRVQIKSEVLEMNSEGGLYRVSQVTFTGDNREGDFHCQVQGEAINGGKVDEGVKPK